jgi:D-threo-aldose 1-dehydrogenase
MTADRPSDMRESCVVLSRAMSCWEENILPIWSPCMIPDEYLLAAKDPADRDHRWMEVLESYRALFDLKSKGKVQAVGIGSKDWTIIRELYKQVPFDWVMLANSFTLFSHPREILEFMDRLEADGVGIINSAVFHGGFLTGGDKFDYREVDPSTKMGKFLHDWRERFSPGMLRLRGRPR